MGGAWWGGYYGWRWPHGASQLLEAVTIGCLNAALLSGNTTDDGPLGFIRSQLDAMWELGHDNPVTGHRLVPYRHLDGGWTDFRPCDPRLPIACWLLSYDAEDADRAHRMASRATTWGNPVARAVKGNGAANTEHWFEFVRGTGPVNYPARILAADRELMSARLAAVRNDNGDPTEWDIHHWQNASPVFAEGLVQTMLGAPLHLYHGGLQHATLRYFDAGRERAGLPPDTSALVSHLDRGGADLELVHVGAHTGSERVVLIQAGAFGEHKIADAIPLAPSPGGTLAGSPIDVSGPWLRIRLAPGSVVRVRLELQRLARSPSYDTPWVQCRNLPPLLHNEPIDAP